MARPTTFDRAVFDRICERMAGGETLRAICRDDGMPPMSTVQGWVLANPQSDISGQYARARECLADWRADEIIEIADDSRLSPDDRRVRVDARKWASSKLNPRLYSDRVQQQHTGNPANPIVTEVVYRWGEPEKTGGKDS